MGGGNYTRTCGLQSMARGGQAAGTRGWWRLTRIEEPMVQA